MKKNNIKKILSSDKGITLVALLITVAIMIIILGISMNTGIETVNQTRLQGFYTQLEIIQKRVDDIATTNESYCINNEDGTKTYVNIKEAGGDVLKSAQSTFVQKILTENGYSSIPVSEFKYFTIAQLEEQLDLSEIKYNVFIHFDTRTVIAERGITVDGDTYYVLKNNMYYPEQNTTKNEGIIDLTYNISKYGNNNYKIIVTPNKVGDLETDGTLRYKKTTTKYWETANGLEIVISDLGEYNIEYIDSNKNSVVETIEVSLNKSGAPIVTEKE